ncbi:uncharacterized protein V1510DRAFT_415370 [Dipodascopsis tothii]|uniref:uncharacterized protein n=1 Tax=Dipodascopsis tothii TaxID=44089 RepID=UPI0034CE4952
MPPPQPFLDQHKPAGYGADVVPAGAAEPAVATREVEILLERLLQTQKERSLQDTEILTAIARLAVDMRSGFEEVKHLIIDEGRYDIDQINLFTEATVAKLRGPRPLPEEIRRDRAKLTDKQIRHNIFKKAFGGIKSTNHLARIEQLVLTVLDQIDNIDDRLDADRVAGRPRRNISPQEIRYRRQQEEENLRQHVESRERERPHDVAVRGLGLCEHVARELQRGLAAAAAGAARAAVPPADVVPALPARGHEPGEPGRARQEDVADPQVLPHQEVEPAAARAPAPRLGPGRQPAAQERRHPDLAPLQRPGLDHEPLLLAAARARAARAHSAPAALEQAQLAQRAPAGRARAAGAHLQGRRPRCGRPRAAPAARAPAVRPRHRAQPVLGPDHDESGQHRAGRGRGGHLRQRPQPWPRRCTHIG